MHDRRQPFGKFRTQLLDWRRLGLLVLDQLLDERPAMKGRLARQ
jgi:hypothetical protein